MGSLFSSTVQLQELSKQLDAEGKTCPQSFQALVSALAQENLAAAERADLEQYERQVQDWEAERRELVQRELEFRAKAEEERAQRLAAKAAAAAAAQQAAQRA